MLSRRIEQLLLLLREVRAEYDNVPSPDAISIMRRDAELKIAKKLGIKDTTVSNKYRRELRPDCDSAEDFDLLLTTWITDDADRLMHILIAHTVTEDDIKQIKNFFQFNDIYLEIYSYESINIEKAIEFTSDLSELDKRVNILVSQGKLKRPFGNHSPRRVQSNSTSFRYERSPIVKAWVLQEAKGHCELCGELGPFKLPNGDLYLEVHHVKQLVEGGPDTVENTVALCPNCHRNLHFGADANLKRETLYKRISRLTR